MSNASDNATSVAPLLRVLTERVIPPAQQWGMQRIVVVLPPPDSATSLSDPLPAGVQRRPKKRRGRRVAVRGPHLYGFASNTARWPEDGLVTSRLPVIACVIEGRADLHVGDHLFSCDEGHFIFLPPGVAYPDGSRAHLEGNCSETRSCGVLWMYPWGNAVICNICHSCGAQHSTLGQGETCLISSSQAALYLNALMEEATSRADGYEVVCQNLLVVLLTILKRELQAGRFLQPGVTIAEDTGTLDGRDPIAHAQEYIRTHLNQRLTIDGVARLTYMSRAQFTKQFRRATDKSFITYLTEQRLAEAEKLLRSTDLSVDMVSHFVGLKPTHLRRLFQVHHKVPPVIYRRQHRQGGQANDTLQTR